MLQRYLIVWLLALCSLAYAWPSVQGVLPLLPDPFLATTARINSMLIAITMFAVGMMLPKNELQEVVERWPLVLFGTALQYTSMPLLAFWMGQVFDLKFGDVVGLAIVGCVPGAMASNVITFNARGNTSYSVSLTTVATILSPIAVPLLLRLCLSSQQQVRIPVIATSLNLLLTVVVPVLAGYLVSSRFPRAEQLVNRVGTTIANLAILWIIASVVGKWRQHFEHLPMRLVWALVSVNLLGYAAGYGGAFVLRLSPPMRRALTLEIGMQNAGLGVKLAAELFPGQAAEIAPALYTFGCMFTGTILARMWSTYDSRKQAAPEQSRS